MTIDEKNKKIENYCTGRSCYHCLLKNYPFHKLGHCYGTLATDAEVEHNYEIIFSKEENQFQIWHYLGQHVMN